MLRVVVAALALAAAALGGALAWRATHPAVVATRATSATVTPTTVSSTTIPTLASTTSTTSLSEVPGARLVIDICRIFDWIDARVSTRQTDINPTLRQQLAGAYFEAQAAVGDSQEWAPVAREVQVLSTDLSTYGPINPVPGPSYSADLADLNVVCAEFGPESP